jgi:hypothetical protein
VLYTTHTHTHTHTEREREREKERERETRADRLNKGYNTPAVFNV